PRGMRSLLRSAAARAVTAASVLTRTTRLTRYSRRRQVARSLDTGGFLGASVTSWIATSPSLLPRTWWMWAANIGVSQMYGYATGVVAERLVVRAAQALGVQVSIEPEHHRRARLLGAAALMGITAYSWTRGVLRQREISHLVGQEPKNVRTAAVGA